MNIVHRATSWHVQKHSNDSMPFDRKKARASKCLESEFNRFAANRLVYQLIGLKRTQYH